jgi:hypothetical protein
MTAFVLSVLGLAVLWVMLKIWQLDDRIVKLEDFKMKYLKRDDKMREWE